MRPELRLLNLHFLNICRHHPTLKFKPHATDDERYVSGIDGVHVPSINTGIILGEREKKEGIAHLKLKKEYFLSEISS